MSTQTAISQGTLVVFTESAWVFKEDERDNFRPYENLRSPRRLIAGPDKQGHWKVDGSDVDFPMGIYVMAEEITAFRVSDAEGLVPSSGRSDSDPVAARPEHSEGDAQLKPTHLVSKEIIDAGKKLRHGDCCTVNTEFLVQMRTLGLPSYSFPLNTDHNCERLEWFSGKLYRTLKPATISAEEFLVRACATAWDAALSNLGEGMSDDRIRAIAEAEAATTVEMEEPYGLGWFHGFMAGMEHLRDKGYFSRSVEEELVAWMAEGPHDYRMDVITDAWKKDSPPDGKMFKTFTIPLYRKVDAQ